MTPIRVRPVEAGVWVSPCRARLPFRFGMTTMTAAPLATCAVTVELEEGERATGYSSDLLVPKWFEKNAEQPISKDWSDLLAAQAGAIDLCLQESRFATVFEHWRTMYAALVESVPRGASDALVRGEGVSLVERALIDAACRSRRVGLRDALAGGVLGFDAGSLDDAVAGWNAASALPDPVRSVRLRHTVGLADALEPEDIGTRVGDGLPECLVEDIRAFGLTHFKIKITSDDDAQIDRLARIWEVILREVGADARVTLDGNEQFTTVRQVNGALQRVQAESRFEGLLERLLLIEQPLHRDRTFDPAATDGLAELARYAPCIIDEADLGLWSLPEAAALGYGGVSIKNCKGVFRAVLNRARCDRSGGKLLQSGEDLTNLPLLALQQDLATMAALGVRHVERNGHHYFRGLDHLPSAELDAATRMHADLYRTQDAFASLHIDGGSLSLGSVVDAPGFGYAGPVELSARTPADRWDPESLV